MENQEQYCHCFKQRPGSSHRVGEVRQRGGGGGIMWKIFLFIIKKHDSKHKLRKYRIIITFILQFLGFWLTRYSKGVFESWTTRTKTWKEHPLGEGVGLLRSWRGLQRSLILIKYTLDWHNDYEDLELCRNLARGRDAEAKKAGGVWNAWETEWRASHGKRVEIFNTYDNPALLKGADVIQLSMPKWGWQNSQQLTWSNELIFIKKERGRNPQDWELTEITNCRYWNC